MDPRKTVLLDEAELVLLMFEYLTSRDPERRPKGPARVTMARVEEQIDAERNVADKVALTIAGDLTQIAMGWIAATINEQSMADGLGEAAKKISTEEARQ